MTIMVVIWDMNAALRLNVKSENKQGVVAYRSTCKGGQGFTLKSAGPQSEIADANGEVPRKVLRHSTGLTPSFWRKV